ncbi:MAG: hypothetical protein QM793_07480 [Muricomes sp.]
MKVFPGVQNQENTSKHIAEAAKVNHNATIAFMETAEIAGGKGAGFMAEWKADGVQYRQDSWCIFVNQSVYNIYSTYQENISKEEKELMSAMIESIRIFSPQKVDAENKTATYKEEFPDAKAFAGAEFKEKADTLKELPFVYYGSWWNKELFANEGWDVYNAENLVPSFYLYSDSAMYWSWGWDTNVAWDFYANAADYYQIYALSRDAGQEKEAKEKEATDKVAVVWDFGAGKMKDGATRQQYQDALTVVDALSYEVKKQELKGILDSVNTTLTAKDKATADKAAADKAAADKAAADKAAADKAAAAKAAADKAAADAAARAAAQAPQEGRGDLIEDDDDYWDYDPWSDPGDSYDPWSDPGDSGYYY